MWRELGRFQRLRGAKLANCTCAERMPFPHPKLAPGDRLKTAFTIAHRRRWRALNRGQIVPIERLPNRRLPLRQRRTRVNTLHGERS